MEPSDQNTGGIGGGGGDMSCVDPCVLTCLSSQRYDLSNPKMQTPVTRGNRGPSLSITIDLGMGPATRFVPEFASKALHSPEIATCA